MKNWLVVGGGLRGIVAAVLLRRADYDVTLVDSASALGGIMCSDEWDGFYIDKGCHVLDFGHEATGQLYKDILGENLLPVHVRYASINLGLKSDGIAVPDLSQFPEVERVEAISQLVKAASSTGDRGNTLADMLIHRYGQIAGDYAVQCVKKFSGYAANDLAVEAFRTLRMVRRMRLGPDEEMQQLKSEPHLDERLAVSTQDQPWRYHERGAGIEHRNAYPSEKGMRGFCEAAAAYLEKIGVKVLLESTLTKVGFGADGVKAEFSSGEAITAWRCYWAVPSSLFLRTLGINDPLVATSLPASISLYRFKVAQGAVGPYTYIHNYSPGTHVFRASAPGVYGNQSDEQGNTYVCAEVPMLRGTPLWEAAEDLTDEIWQEMGAMGQVSNDAKYAGARVDKIPFAYVLPNPDWAKAKVAHDQLLEPFAQQVIFSGHGSFGGAAILDDVQAEIDNY